MYYQDHRLIKLKVPASIMGQIKCIVEHFTTEVSWYGDITQEGDTITINKIYLFPQVVTGGTFRTDTPQVSELYDSWYEEKLGEVADHYDKTQESLPIMQYNGHSHVNAACTASSEDMNFRKARQGLNVYSIHNKQNGVNWEVWDDEMVYEHVDIDIIYEDNIFANADTYVLQAKAVAPIYGRNVYQQQAYNAQLNRRAVTNSAYLEDELDAFGLGSFYSKATQ